MAAARGNRYEKRVGMGWTVLLEEVGAGATANSSASLRNDNKD